MTLSEFAKDQLDPKSLIPLAKLRIGFETFGCRSNYSDTVDLQAACLENGAMPCDARGEADVYVINTCTVTDSADREAYSYLRRLRERSPSARIVVTGCLAAAAGESLNALAIDAAVVPPGNRRAVLDAVFGTASLAGNTEHTERRFEPLSRALPSPDGYFGEVPSRHRFHLRVQEGCENSCTFCIIPQTRGALRSRPIPLILEDISRLGELGFGEIVLTGTHLGGYGEDLSLALVDLLSAIELSRPTARIRLSSLDPNDITPQIISLLGKSHVFCNHLHICVQAFSDRLLKRMNRRYRMRDVEWIIRQIEREFSHCSIGSDLITGFPGESREDVDQGIETFLGLPFSYLHIFPYSERTGTAATRLNNVVPLAERRRRAARWRSIAERRRRSFLETVVGRQLEVVFEEVDEASLYGTSREFARVSLPRRRAARRERELLNGRRTIVRALRISSSESTVVCEL